MAKVPEMTFCANGTPALPTAKEVQLHRSFENRFSLKGKNALVTGGARGLGLMIGRGFLQHGLSKLALFDVDEGQGDLAARKLSEEFPDATITFKMVEVTDAPAIQSAITKTAAELEGIHVLATFAGVVNSTASLNYTLEGFRKIVDANTAGTFLTAQEPEMIERKTGGSIILTASMAGHAVNSPEVHVAYSTAKAAIHHMTRCLAAEWAVHGIRVNSLSPGYMGTRLNKSSDLVDVLPTWYERNPMGLMGEKEELIGPVVMMASPAGSFMTGSDMVVDGGYTLT
ncbi:NAD(P)-binding protein [Massarina eburnea CBS 473.64]|uniref:NAD(P)-binding protein n=1 Tax=Massarina eburnea CBS 473.64 TaxID=1395130 RepID=A0A6A6S7A3_9PLEO|nr:NAD(P)-binding protein [Massarina eburnea CBS 473.64]